FRQKSRVPKGLSCTANTLVKKSVFYQVGKFDSTLKSGADWAFSQRSIEQGFRIEYEAFVMVRHPARKTLRAFFKKHFRHVCWNSVTIRREYHCSQLRVLLSSLKGSLRRLFKPKTKVSSMYERL